MSGLHNNSANLGSFCRSIGLIYDQTSTSTEPLCSTFLVAEKKTASLASLISPFASTPEALRLVFPYAEREFGVTNIHFHPQFDRSLKRKTLFHGTLGNGPEAALQKHNCCILELGEKSAPMPEAKIEEVSKSLRFPLNLTEEGFRGSLSEIELPLVLQTLNNAKKQGILYLCDELHRPLAQVYCQDGRIMSAKYRTLMNEMAIFQIVEKRITGKFVFRACKPPSWMPAQSIGRSTDTILIEAMRRMDENKTLREQLRINDYYLVRAYKQLYLDGVTPANRQAAEMIWRALDGTTPADQLWNLVPLDDYTIFTALVEMYRANQCMRVPLAGTMEFAIPPAAIDEGYAPAFMSGAPLPLGVQLQLNAFDTISSISIDPITSKARVKVGSLLGAIDPYDAEHLLHDIPLLPWSSGSPLIKDDLVIGMHCGLVPTSSALDSPFGVLQQMLWCDSIAQILLTIPGTIIPPSVPMTAPTSTSIAEANAAVAAVKGPNSTGNFQAVAKPTNTGNQPALQKPTSTGNQPAMAKQTTTGNQPALSTPEPTPNSVAAQSASSGKNASPASGSVAAAKSSGESEKNGKGLPGCREIASLKCNICGERTFSSARRCMRCLNEFVPQFKQPEKRVKFDLAMPIAAGIAVIVAASAAYAWVQLPSPNFQNVEMMSIPNPGWVEALIKVGVQVNAPGQAAQAKWEAQPNNVTLPAGRLIHFYCKANKACYIHLLYKGSSGGASRIKLDKDTLAAGDHTTYPAMTEITTDKGPSLNGSTISGPPGADEFLVVASRGELPWLDANTIDEVFKKGNEALKLSKSKTGVVVFERQIMPSATPDKSSADNQIFLTSVTFNH